MKKTNPIVIALLAVCLLPSSGHAQSCKEPDGLSYNLIHELRRIASNESSLRDSLRFPRVENAKVEIVTDSAVCDRVRQALDSMIVSNTPDPKNLGPRPIYAIRVNSYFAVVNPGSRAGEWIPVFIFDNCLRHLSTLAF